MNISQGKVFEKPVGGSYVGTIIDVVDMPNQSVVYNGVTTLVDKVRIQWVLAHANGAPYLDKEGQAMTVAVFPSAKQAKNSRLTKLLTYILNAAPPLINTTEQLSELLLGRSNSLFLVQEPDTRNPGQFFTNVAGIAPLPAGIVPPAAPAGFVRSKDKPKTQGGPNPGQATQTYAQRPVAPAPAVNLNAAAPQQSSDAF